MTQSLVVGSVQFNQNAPIQYGVRNSPDFLVLTQQMKELQEREAILLSAIKETVLDNLHLADGDNCTLIKLTRILKQLGIEV